MTIQCDMKNPDNQGGLEAWMTLLRDQKYY